MSNISYFISVLSIYHQTSLTCPNVKEFLYSCAMDEQLYNVLVIVNPLYIQMTIFYKNTYIRQFININTISNVKYNLLINGVH